MATPTPQPALRRDERVDRRKMVVDSGLVTVEMCPAGFGLMVNVSEHGIGVYTLTNLRPGKDVQVTFTVPGSPQRIECAGEVRWSEDSHAGLRFKYVHPKSVVPLKQWLTTLPGEPSKEQPVSHRREFPALDQQVRTIEAHIAEAQFKLDEALQFMVVRLLELTEASGGAIALGDSGQIVCRASAGLAPEVGTNIGSNSGVTGECIRTGTTIYCEDTELDARVDREVCRQLNLRSSLIVPILREQKAAGVLELFSPKPRAFDDSHRWLAKQIAELTTRVAYDVTPPAAVPVAAAVPAPVTVKPKPTVPREPTGAIATKISVDKPVTAIAVRVGRVATARWLISLREAMSRIRGWLMLALIITAMLLLLLGWHYSKKATRTVGSSTGTEVPASWKPATEEITAAGTVKLVSIKPIDTPRHVETSSLNSKPHVTEVPVTLNIHRGGHRMSTGDSQPESAPTVELAGAINMPAVTLPTMTDLPELKPGSLVGGKLIHRVEPEYPANGVEAAPSR